MKELKNMYFYMLIYDRLFDLFSIHSFFLLYTYIHTNFCMYVLYKSTRHMKKQYNIMLVLSKKNVFGEIDCKV